MAKTTPMRAIRKKCLSCAFTAKEVTLCHIESCPLWGYRSGHRPTEPMVEDSPEEEES